MKKNIIIGVLTLTSLSFFLFAFVQKTQNEELQVKLNEAKSMANMYRAESEHVTAIAKEQAERAQMAVEMAQVEAVKAKIEAEKLK